MSYISTGTTAWLHTSLWLKRERLREVGGGCGGIFRPRRGRTQNSCSMGSAAKNWGGNAALLNSTKKGKRSEWGLSAGSRSWRAPRVLRDRPSCEPEELKFRGFPPNKFPSIQKIHGGKGGGKQGEIKQHNEEDKGLPRWSETANTMATVGTEALRK